MTQPLLQAADLRGATRLTTEAVAGLASLVEAMHAGITSLPKLPAKDEASEGAARTRGVTGLVYSTVRGVTHLAGAGAQALLDLLTPALTPVDPQRPPRPEREAILAALNGVLGDHLAATGNPLAIPMQFRHQGRPLMLERQTIRSRLGATTPLLVMLHGLCMNDLQWRRADHDHDHGEALARDLGYTPVYLHYNSGLSISTNGRILALQMEALYSTWPAPVERPVMLGHSMGGLVARSAIYHGALMARSNLRWPLRVNDLICLGSPHLGAPLERAGHGVDLLLGAAPYAAPLARLGKLRSAGINDLRLGNILAAPTANEDEHATGRAGLPPQSRCYAIAGSLGAAPGSLKSKLLGDGLVPVESALGQDEDPDVDLGFAPEHQAVVYRTGHLDLLSSAEVYGLLRQWLE